MYQSFVQEALFIKKQTFAKEVLPDKKVEIFETPFWQKGFWIALGKISWKTLHTEKVSAFQQDTANSPHSVFSGTSMVL